MCLLTFLYYLNITTENKCIVQKLDIYKSRGILVSNIAKENCDQIEIFIQNEENNVPSTFTC